MIMRKIIFTILVLSAGVFAQNGTEGAKGTDVAILNFAFMKGCWVIERPERKTRIEEQWMAPAGNTLIGMSRTVRDGKTTGWEYMWI